LYALALQFLGLLAPPAAADQPSSEEVRGLLEAAAGRAPAARAVAEARLRSIVRRYPAVVKQELLRLRAQEGLLAAILGEEGETQPVGVFFEENLR
jgi:hypothetical protein